MNTYKRDQAALIRVQLPLLGAFMLFVCSFCKQTAPPPPPSAVASCDYCAIRNKEEIEQTLPGKWLVAIHFNPISRSKKTKQYPYGKVKLLRTLKIDGSITFDTSKAFTGAIEIRFRRDSVVAKANCTFSGSWNWSSPDSLNLKVSSVRKTDCRYEILENKPRQEDLLYYSNAVDILFDAISQLSAKEIKVSKSTLSFETDLYYDNYNIKGFLDKLYQ